MKTRFRLFETGTMLRAAIVAAGAGTVCYVAAQLMRLGVDRLWRVTNYTFYWQLFYVLGEFQSAIILLLFVLVMAFFSNWILYPSYLAFAREVTGAIHLDENGRANKPQLPKQFKALETQLQEAGADLERWRWNQKEAEKRKDDLVVYLAHDLRTPLTSVLGYLDLLETAGDLPAAQRKRYTAIALRKAQRMQALVEELFDVTRYDITNIELHRQKVKLSVLLHQLTEELEPALTTRALTLSHDLEEGCTAFADPEKLARAVDNLLHNATSYAPEGGHITLRLRGKGPAASICVENENLEVDPRELERCFERFYRGDAARQSRSGGHGLGLAIAKAIVEAHGGTISAESSGGTTRFTITLPTALDNL